MNRAIVIHAPGDSQVLKMEPSALARPQRGEVRVRHTAIGLNMIDTYHRKGLYPLPRLPHGIGIEAAGVIEELGEGVTELELGQRVAYAGGVPGAYADARNVPADRLVVLPDSISDEQAAAALLKGMTVEYLVRRTFCVEAGMPVLFHAAAGGVGVIACQWLHHLGATVIGTVGSDAKAEVARAHGCDHAIVYTREDFVARVRELSGGRGVPVVYDSVGRTTFAGSLACLARRGMLVGFGNASGPPEPFDPLELARGGSLYLTRPSLVDYTATRAELMASASALFEVMNKGVVRVPVHQRFPLDQAAEAHRALEARETTGASLLIP
jgi:NADPH2:quinone reductase